MSRQNHTAPFRIANSKEEQRERETNDPYQHPSEVMDKVMTQVESLHFKTGT